VKVARLRIDASDADGSFPLLLLGEDGSTIAETSIPPHAVVMQLGGNACDPVEIVQRLLATPGYSPDLGTIGRHLHELVDRDDVGVEWQALRAAKGGATPEVCIQLDIRAPHLAQLPWELLNDEGNRLAFVPRQPLSRYHEVRPVVTLAPPTWPMRVLIVLGSDDSAIAALSEMHAIERLLTRAKRTVDVEICLRPKDERELVQAYEFRPHVLHFIGHCSTSQGEAGLMFKGADGISWPWTASAIRVAIETADWLPRFVFVNACRSGENRMPPGESRWAWDIGQVFRDLGTPGVLTMQADVTGKHAKLFAERLYERLIERDPIDVAVSQARNIVRMEPGVGFDHREWAVPSLSLSLPADQVITLRPDPTTAIENAIRQCNLLKQMDRFVGRRRDCRKVIGRLNPVPCRDIRRVAIVHGLPQVGKTWMAWWCMESCMRGKHEVRYLQIVDHESKSWLDVLLMLRNGKLDADPCTAPLPEEAFGEFDWELVQRMKGMEPAGPWPGAPMPAIAMRLADIAQPSEHFVERTFASFRRSLERMARAHELVLVLDQFTNREFSLSKESWNALRDHLVMPIAEGAVPGVKIVLIFAREKTGDEFGLQDLTRSLEPYIANVEVAPFEAADFERLAREYFQDDPISSDPNFDMLVALAASVAKKQGNWFPLDLNAIPTAYAVLTARARP
jgi:hypothetical protein